jgi:hypothetical protein
MRLDAMRPPLFAVRDFRIEFESERRRYVCAWSFFVWSFAADSLYRDRRDWDERDRGDSADDGVFGFGF